MHSKRHKRGIGGLSKWLFLCSLIFCLCLSHVSLTTWQAKSEEVITAQVRNLSSNFPEIRWSEANQRQKSGSYLSTGAYNQLLSLELLQDLSQIEVQFTDASQYIHQGIKNYAAGDFQDAIKQWQIALTFYQKTQNPFPIGIINNLARAYQHIGESELAIAYWEQAIAYYRQIKDMPQVGLSLTQEAQGYNSLGQTAKAIALAESALEITHTYKNIPLQAAALGSRGEAYRLQGNYKRAIIDLENSLKCAQQINNTYYYYSALKSLGNVYINLTQVNYRRPDSTIQADDKNIYEQFRKQAWSDDAKAWEYLQKGLNIARDRGDKLGEMRLLLNSILLDHRYASNLASVAVQQALVLLEQLPDSLDKVYAAIDLANLVQFPPVDPISYLVACPRSQKNAKVLDLLVQAVSTAQRLKSFSVLSFAIGNLGHFYECRQDYQQALKLTIQAQRTAKQGLNTLEAKNRLFLWNWQAGRILKAQNKVFDAIKAYRQTFESLKYIRSLIWTIHPYLQVSFRDIFEPLYRQFIDINLSLEDEKIANEKKISSVDNLNSVIATVDNLQLVKAQNYCVNDCKSTIVNNQQDDVIKLRENTAIFYSIILEKHTAIIVSFPNGYKKFKWINIDSKTLREEVNKFRIGLENYGDITYNPKRAQKLYSWIVRPFARDLKSLQIKTLVFIQDGVLRSVPMAALHDGEKFLVEKYAIATTPSLTLTNPQTVHSKNLRALAVGLTKDAIVSGRRYEALSNVASEIRQVKEQIPGSKYLLDENFTSDRLQAELHKTVYQIIHIATHGEFGNFPEDTFLVTGDNDKLTITELHSIIRSLAHGAKTIDLLTLTACDTAIGNDRAALGLAGVAVQAGVRTALASLWSINDASTVELVTKFYEAWRHPGVSKAEALRQAQQALISNGKISAHPAYWAAFILIGNWL
ncbi:CHAT domain-containing protein [Komarekiella sp. 'clone 1']|uniref:CHAT domain-containing protein n=1 Tax=Komarekiella delphini-convector SJRDD-AB1 TaxID=2593771 RepID=A0AA40VQV0_9NOST|nr:CHAT domain-containing protein [Komarekiella delphini-convector]MBD6616559.1 CHAT domain-containing protein [Komarekiella delphini-convector SJRDD-AB1]